MVSGSIDEADEIDVFTFTGQAGDVILLTTAETSGFTGYGDDVITTLYSPSAMEVARYRTVSNGNQVQVTLPETGTYVIDIWSIRYTPTGTYNLGLEQL